MMRPHPLEARRSDVRLAMFLAIVGTVGPGALELLSAPPSAVVLAVRVVLVLAFAATALVAHRVNARTLHALVTACSALVPPGVTLIIVQFYGALSVTVLFLLAIPLIMAVVFPELPSVAMATGALCFLSAAGMGWAEQIAPLRSFALMGGTVGATGLALLGVRRQRQLRLQRLESATSAARGLHEALAAADLGRHRDEEGLMTAAVNALAQPGSSVVLLRFDGAVLRAQHWAEATAQFGEPVREVLGSVRALDLRAALPVLRDERGLDVTRTGEVKAALETTFGPAAAGALAAFLPAHYLSVPLFVEQAAYGYLVALGSAELTHQAPAIELFARHLETAAENLRALAQAEHNLSELRALEQELLAREQLAAVGEAAAVVAHEVRNPLGVLGNGAAILRREQGLSERGHRSVSTLVHETLGLDGLVKDLLQLARPTPSSEVPASLAEVLQGAVEAMQVSHRNVALERPAPSLRVRGDADELRKAFERLLRHSAHSSGQAGRVEVVTQVEGEVAQVIIDDQGAQVSPDDRESLFEPFSAARADTGLDLAVVRKVIRSYGGSVSVADGALGGARFVVGLPLAGSAE